MPAEAHLDHLPPTELRNGASMGLDRLNTMEILTLINEADATVPAAVAAALPGLGDLVEAGLAALERGGRIHYFGAGAGGRIALGDALELEPTYGVGPETLCPHLAGGPDAAYRAREDAEDHGADTDLAASHLASADLVIGVTASGRTPYVAGALTAARTVGTSTALISCDPSAPLAGLADLHVVLATGPEVVTGSTRMKAGTAQKLALNAFSTTLMVRSGHTWSNLMVSASAGNAKLRERAARTLATACQATPAEALAALDSCDGETPTALVVLAAGATPMTARQALATCGGRPWAAVRALAGPGPAAEYR
ncbi:N-acetylmuramic acid 6-phosphate etherase [Kitasatospora sp. NBC_00240]|uniref:N-acetylmuramic acid 6-phosphate etherase n=1 Tax=Kitasatospora sp. NBC_00240 TaxID=2903567 RepID=UPI00224F2A3B|nr:N-acetylmuramic acid 6-phosphate etherase [Kitasatospora sp. NBC_00240]MCX5213330.1 N-acetylmuramic acid 6-phosphate etherase [Kitasatospora sp. NBC_00240]